MITRTITLMTLFLSTSYAAQTPMATWTFTADLPEKSIVYENFNTPLVQVARLSPPAVIDENLPQELGFALLLPRCSQKTAAAYGLTSPASDKDGDEGVLMSFKPYAEAFELKLFSYLDQFFRVVEGNRMSTNFTFLSNKGTLYLRIAPAGIELALNHLKNDVYKVSAEDGKVFDEALAYLKACQERSKCDY